MDLSSLSSVYSQYTDTMKTSAETEKLTNRIKQSADATDDELMEVCKEFEAYFMEQVYKEMLKTIPKSDDSSSSMLVDYFKDTAISEIASQSVDGGNGVGLAQSLYEQMRRNYEQ